MVIETLTKTPTRIWLLANKVAMAFPNEVPGILEIQWRKSRKKGTWRIVDGKIAGFRSQFSSGVTECLGVSGNTCAIARVTVTAGSDWKDAKLVFLHEMAHAMTPGHNHDKVFWDCAFRLYRWAKLPMLYCRKREMSYKKGALFAYRRGRKAAMQKGTDD